MKISLGIVGLILWALPSWSATSRVYFFDGFYVPLPSASLSQALDQIEEHLKANHPTVEFIKIHNSAWRSVCKDLKEAKPDRLVLIGHSFGGNAAQGIARCLGDQKVDMIIALDSVGKMAGMGPVDEVPENVIWDHNFYENQGVLAGAQNHHRPDGSDRNITNTHILVDDPGSAHYLLVNQVVDSGAMFQMLDSAL